MSVTRTPLVLVTGGAGFIGGHLVDALLRRGFRVRVLDNLAPPTHDGKLPDWFPKRALFMRGDVRNKTDWIKALKGVSYVFHLAAYMDAHADFSAYWLTNTVSVALMFEAIAEKKYPVKKIVAASSQAVYGEGRYRCPRHGVVYPSARPESQLIKKDWAVRCPLDGRPMRILPEREDDELVPSSPYGLSKKAMEEALHGLGRQFGIPTVALRYTLPHGARQTFRHFYSGALRQFAVMAMSGMPMTLHEDGRQLRDFVHIADVTRAHLLVLRSRRADFQTFTVGSGRRERVRDLARAVARAWGCRQRLRTPGLYRMATPRHSLADVGKLRRLGWRPKKTLLDNARDYVAWIKNHPEAKRILRETLKKLEKQGIVRGA